MFVYFTATPTCQDFWRYAISTLLGFRIPMAIFTSSMDGGPIAGMRCSCFFKTSSVVAPQSLMLLLTFDLNYLLAVFRVSCLSFVRPIDRCTIYSVGELSIFAFIVEPIVLFAAGLKSSFVFSDILDVKHASCPCF